jgi:hypothetical protein
MFLSSASRTNNISNARGFAHAVVQNQLSGNHWAVESEIFWKARDERRLRDGTTQVHKIERNAQKANTINSIALHAINTPGRSQKCFKRRRINWVLTPIILAAQTPPYSPHARCGETYSPRLLRCSGSPLGAPRAQRLALVWKGCSSRRRCAAGVANHRC